MRFLTIANQLIPGYEFISKEAQIVFETSRSGQQFIGVIEALDSLATQLSKKSWYEMLWGQDAQKKDFVFHERLAEEKKSLLEQISNTEEFKTVVLQTIYVSLEKEIAEFQWLSREQQEQLAQTEYSKKLHGSILALDASIEQEQQAKATLSWWASRGEADRLEANINELQVKRGDEIDCWKAAFLEHADMKPLRETIDEHQRIIRQRELEQKRTLLHEHATQLSQFFPLLNYRKYATEEPVIEQIRTRYSTENGELTAEPDKVDETLLSDLLHFIMQQMSDVEIDFMNLEAFNRKYSHRIAQSILTAFKENKTCNLDQLLKDYENKLHQHIVKQLQLIHGKHWESPSVEGGDDLCKSLSFLWDNQAVNLTNDFLRKMADAHGFIQATSFSTQNESSFLAILDMYNYARHYEQISEVRSILSSLLSPLHPLYNEYKDIALYEKNGYLKPLRSMIPLTIVVTFIVMAAVILAPLALTELAFTAAAVVAFLIGLGAANLYVSIKNDLYKYLREHYYGGPFEIPEYQVNRRMIDAFQTAENAEQVRAFYIEEIQRCDALETDYHSKHEQGILTQEDITSRKDNITRRHKLCLEWYDIHSNYDLDYKKAQQIAATRLHDACDQKYQELQSTLQEEQQLIRQSVTDVISDLKETIVRHNNPPVEADKQPVANTIKTNYRHGLFTPPKSLKIKAHMEELVDFSTRIKMAG